MTFLNLSSRLAVVALLFAIISRCVATELVQNGGFETNNFAGWTQSGSTQFTGTNTVAHSGQYAAIFSPRDAVGFITQQTLSTVAGGSYLLSFWLQNDGATPNSFSVAWDSSTLLTLSNQAAFGYTQYSFNVVASGNATPLTFGFQGPAFWRLDDVSVATAGVPDSVSVLGLLCAPLAVLVFCRRRAR